MGVTSCTLCRRVSVVAITLGSVAMDYGLGTMLQTSMIHLLIMFLVIGAGAVKRQPFAPLSVQVQIRTVTLTMMVFTRSSAFLELSVHRSIPTMEAVEQEAHAQAQCHPQARQ